MLAAALCKQDDALGLGRAQSRLALLTPGIDNARLGAAVHGSGRQACLGRRVLAQVQLTSADMQAKRSSRPPALPRTRCLVIDRQNVPLHNPLESMTSSLCRPDAQNSPMTMNRHRLTPLAICAALAVAPMAQAAKPTDLSSLSLEQLLQVTVVGATKYEQKQSEVAAAVSVITRSEIKTFGWRTLGEALASLPGVSTTYDRQYGYLGMRGFGLPGDLNTRTLITINGNRVNDPVFDQGPNGRDFPLDIDLIERIEFIPGPGGAIYGQNAMFGVVNVVTRGGADLDGTELSLAQENLTRQTEVRASWGRRFDSGLEMLLSASVLHAKGQDLYFDYGASGIAGVARGADGEENRQVMVQVANGAWTAHFIAGHHRKYDPTAAYQSDPLVPGQLQQDERSVGQVQYQDRFAGDTVQLLARLFAGSEHYTSTLNFGGPFAGPANGEWAGAEVRLLLTRFDGHKLMFGTELQNNLKQDQYNLNLNHPENNISIRNKSYRTGVYVQDEWRIASTLTATLGLRFDRDKVSDWQASPRAALIWNPSTESTVKALYGRAHRAPNAFERDYRDDTTQVANPALSGETIDTVEWIVDQRLRTDFAVRASAYQWAMRDLVTLGIDPISGLSQYQAGGRIKARGLELSGDKTWSGGARLRGSVSLQHVADAAGAQLPNSPTVLSKLAFSSPLTFGGLHAGYELRHNSARRTLDGSTLGGYVISNLSLSTQSVARGVNLSINAYNLLDKRSAQPGSRTNWQNAFAQDGRSLRLKLDYSY
jgi:outer membrane receptor protein involved in Fe transport